MEFNLETEIAVPPLVHRYEKGEWTLLYDPRNQSVIRANPQGLLVIEAVARHGRLGEAIQYISENQQMEFDQVAGPVIEFVANLINSGYLHVDEYRPRRVVDSEELEPPTSIYIQNTEACNLECVYCYNLEERDYFLREHRHMTTEDLKAAIDQVADFGIPQVNFCGGEPTLRKDLLECAEHVRKTGRFVTMVTNGRADSDEFTSAAAKLFDVIWVSLDSHKEEIMRQHRGQGAYEHAVNSLRKLTRVPGRRASIVVSAVISHLNWQDFAEFKRFCLEDLGVDRFRATTYCPGCASSQEVDWPLQPPPFIQDSTVQLPEEVELSDFSDVMTEELELKFDRVKESLFMATQRRNHCGVGKGELSMLSNGDVFPCQLLCKPQFLAGNIFDQPLEQIFRNSQVLNRLRDLTVERIPGCSTCDVQYVCAGGCRANAMEMHGNIEAHNDYQCDFFHRLAVDALWKDSMIPVQEVAQARQRYQDSKQQLQEQNFARGTPAAEAEGKLAN